MKIYKNMGVALGIGKAKNGDSDGCFGRHSGAILGKIRLNQGLPTRTSTTGRRHQGLLMRRCLLLKSFWMGSWGSVRA